MARGIANNERTVSQANTKAYEEGYEASGLGKSEGAKERGRWVWDPKLQKLVRPWEYDWGNQEMARNAPISTDRHYEGTRSPIDGADIGSRRRHQDHMRRHGVVSTSDYDGKGGFWEREAKKRAEGFSSAEHKKDRKERLKREMERVTLMRQKDYDKEVKVRRAAREKRGTAVPTTE